jgi:isopentenyl-diphosphate delta-isomerase
MSEAEEQVVLVDADDRETGVAGKMEAHRKGLLHRAISVFVHDGVGWQLLQKRQRGKYHSQGQWTNACCSHPRPGEDSLSAAHRRLREEMNFDCPLQFLFSTIYKRGVGNGLVEHELVHVFSGQYTGLISPDPAEADGYQWVTFEALQAGIARDPDAYTPWLRVYLETQGERLRDALQG